MVLSEAITLIVTAAYYLWSMQRTIFEGGRDDHNHPISKLPFDFEARIKITWHENTGMLVYWLLFLNSALSLRNV